jgi:hypothetical protein
MAILEGSWDQAAYNEFAGDLQRAIESMEQSLYQPAPFNHREDMGLNEDKVKERIEFFRGVLRNPALAASHTIIGSLSQATADDPPLLTSAGTK